MSLEEKQPIVSIEDFTMKFGSKTVIDNLSFEINKGETFGLLGSNGSGKTTILRALLGIYPATKGKLLINGKKFTPELGGKIGYLPEELKGVERQAAKEWSLEYLKRVDLADKAKMKIDKLSGGQQQKVQLGVTIMNNPEILILDEPTKGFDPINRRLLMDIIDEQKAKGSTVILITHDMAEVERLCDRLLLLKNGNKHAYGTVPEVLKKFNKKNMDDVFLEVYGAHAREEILDNGQAS